MKVDGGMALDLHAVPERIRELEETGYDAAMSAETSNDPFFPILLAAEHSERIELMTSIAGGLCAQPR